MQRDTSLTFGDIHGSEEALLANVKEIENHVLVQESERKKSLRLRLLEIPDIQPDDKTFILNLTDFAEPKPGQEWVSVSYCWTYSETPNDRSIPNYQILASSSNPWRKPDPACPIAVLHRAVRFAQSRNCSYIWIDQENMNQDDPTDIERHLQVMHRIYSESRWTIAVLSCKIPSQSILDTLLAFLTIDPDHVPRKVPNVDPRRRVMQYIIGDRWFRRAWTFQERQCASSLDLLIPTSSQLTITKESSPMFVDTDLCVSSRDFLRQITAFGYDEWEHGFTAGYSWDDYVPYFSQVDKSHSGIHVAFDFVEMCDISIFADKLAIYGNIYDMPYQLKTTLLRKSEYSYSTCLLVLVMASIWPGKEERMAKYVDMNKELCNQTIKDFVQKRDRESLTTWI